MISGISQETDRICPEDALHVLRQFSEGLLPADRHDAVLRHLSDCPRCEAALAGLIHRSELNASTPADGEVSNTAEFESFHANLKKPKEPDVKFEIGDSIGNFQMIRKLGKGGFSTVFECLDGQMQRNVAVKFLNLRFYDDSSLARLELEARALARLDHPWIIKAYEIRPYHFPPYIVLELVAGGASSKLIAKNPLPPRTAARLIAGVARAVHHAHEFGIVHRDIKPSNLLVVQPIDPDEPLPADLSLKVSDFGLARSVGIDSRITSTNAIIGTPAYMSPEQSRGRQSDVGPATDIYSMGVVLYEYLIGRPPLIADNPMQTMRMIETVEPVPPRVVQPAIPRDLDTICMRCLRKDPAERYATARELAEDLQRFLDGRPILARPIGPAGRLYRWTKRNASLAASIGCSILLLVLLAGLSFRFAIVQKDLRQRADRNAERYELAARKAEESRDLARNVMFSSVDKFSRIADEMDRVVNPSEVRNLSEKARRMNRETLDTYFSNLNQMHKLTGENIDIYFRDALVIMSLKNADLCFSMLNKLIDLAKASQPDHPDHLLRYSAANRAAHVIAFAKRSQANHEEARIILSDAWRRFRIDAHHPGLKPSQMYERRIMLAELLALQGADAKTPENTMIANEIRALDERIAWFHSQASPVARNQ